MQNRAKLKIYVRELLDRKGDNAPFTDDDSLLLTGRLDSLNVLEIVTFMETELQFSLKSDLFDQNAYDSIDSMMELIERA